MLKFFKLISYIVAFFICLVGCNEADLPELKNVDIESFWGDYQLQKPELKRYIIDDVLILPFFSPVSNYEKFELALTVFSVMEEKELTLKEIEVDGIGTVFKGSVKLGVSERDELSGLFRNDVFLSSYVEIKKLEGVFKKNDNITVIVTVESVDGSPKTLKYEFLLSLKSVAGPLH